MRRIRQRLKEVERLAARLLQRDDRLICQVAMMDASTVPVRPGAQPSERRAAALSIVSDAESDLHYQLGFTARRKIVKLVAATW